MGKALVFQCAMNDFISARNAVQSRLNFALRAWPAYLECFREDGYHYSVDELLVLCQVAKVNVAILEQRADTLFYQGVFFPLFRPSYSHKVIWRRDQKSAKSLREVGP